MLQQMLVVDKCDRVRCACSKSLAMVINEIDDETRLSQVNYIEISYENKSVLFY